MKRVTKVIILLIIAVLIMFITIRIGIQSIQLSREISKLFSLSGNISSRSFSYQQLDGLPEPVQRYFKHALKEGQPYISYVRLIHDGHFKTSPDKDWITINGEQYFTAETPGFIWKGKTSLFTARDKYISDKGRLIVSLFSLFRIVDAHGEKIDHGELLRWLGESVWFPTNLLPSDNLQWSPVDSSTAQLTFNYNDIAVLYLVSFNDKDEIIKMETERYMNENLETWVGTLKNYKEINGISIPTEIEASWKLDDGDYSYVKFNIKKIDFDKPEQF